MGIGSVADAVHTLHDGVHRRVVADSGVSAIKVVVDGSRQTDNGEVELHTEVPGTRQ